VLFAGFAASTVLATFATLTRLTTLSTFATFTTLSTFTETLGFTLGAVRCAHCFVAEVGTVVVCDGDATGECCSECECPTCNDRGDRDGFAVLREC
jgi:hypothetical protein